MLYSIDDAKDIVKFFRKDFFEKELGYILPPIFVDRLPKDEDKFGDTSEYRNGYLIRLKDKIFDNRKLLVNTILHEMIHVLDGSVNGKKQSKYGAYHGAFWNKYAKIASDYYGEDIGIIQRYATEEESKKLSWIKSRDATKTIRNCYIINLDGINFIVAKYLNREEIEKLTEEHILAIYKAPSNYKSSSLSKRVEKYANFEEIQDMIKNGVLTEFTVDKPDFSQLKKIWYNYTF